ncbi:MAG: hypothetical protein WAN12_11205 [Candidatus Acidiferrum sp.]
MSVTTHRFPGILALLLMPFLVAGCGAGSSSSVTLSWEVTASSYVIVSPGVGATRSTSVSISPSATTTYTLYATNAYGQTTASTTITVHLPVVITELKISVSAVFFLFGLHR